MIAKDTLNMKQFPRVVSSDCRNIRRIYPLKQKQVAQIYDEVKNSDIVRRVIVFGSSVTGKCHINSDLDICIDADVSDGMKVFELQKQIGEICDWNCDILIYSNLGNRLRDTIDREGLLSMSSLLARARADIEISRILLTEEGNPTHDEMITDQAAYHA